jgi:ATP-dependent helicase/nuclease subunit A
MTAPRIIPEAVLRLQIAASDPATSAWVAANAGSGKTHVLAQRVIRLLLDGVDPGKILCITFTKAAAANMANRVFEELRRWTALDDAKLAAVIQRMSHIDPDAALLARARRLFALALETPGGLKVQTIHAFCTRLLHSFPFEANVAARFDVLDDAAETQLLNESSLAVLLDAALDPNAQLGRALTAAIAVAADRTFKEVVAEAIRKRDIVRAWIDHGGSIDKAIAVLCRTLGIAAHDTLEQVEHEIIAGPILPASEWAAVARLCEKSTARDQDQCARLTSALAASGAQRVESYFEVFFDSKLKPRPGLLTQGFARRHPDLAKRLEQEQERLIPLRERRRAIACRDRTAALITIADAVIARYQAAKDRRGLLDYDDLIDKALMLLSEERAAWVHYKLDQGIDHVLIDEAQDTSPKQWEIIRLLTADFFTGSGARLVNRTVFAVGDEKQSIFSFQGAAPREFDAMRRDFTRRCAVIERELHYVPFRHSFRSGANVLGAVDEVFGRPEAYAGLAAEPVRTVHEFLPDAPPGLVELWETTKPKDKREIEAWDAPFDDLTETSPQVRLARRIASNIKRWINQGARAGDVLVLVRQRGALFEAIIRALKDAHIEVAGADRLVLTEHIAVMDLMVLADALLLPADDLALATALKSPLLGLTEEELFEIAWQRKGSLRTALRAKAGEKPRFAEAAAKLDRFGEWARRDAPFDFYARVLGPERGRRRFLARLGHEANDALDELLNLALDYERRETPSLQGFLAWLRSAQTDVKRDMEIGRDEVRVMTVHGAKGLEAPIVVLADTITPPAGPALRQPRLIELTADHAPDHFVWPGPKANDVAPVAAARERVRVENEEEHRRLLYVAMTRAINRLVVCGAEGERGPPPGCWWELVAKALQPVAEKGPADDGEGDVWRYRPVLPLASAPLATAAAPDTAAQEPPAWLGRVVSGEVASPPPLSPSRVHDERTAPKRTKAASGQLELQFAAESTSIATAKAVGPAERERAMARGTIVHRLLQSLPDIPRAARDAAARQHLARAARAFSVEEQEAMLDQVRRVLDNPRFLELFSRGSRAEVSIVGRLQGKGRTVPVSGQVDRLAVTADAVLIADYKTNSPAPRRIEDVPPAYVTQLALYRAVLSRLYPGKPVRTVLIWTEVPDLMEISATSLDPALNAVTSA